MSPQPMTRPKLIAIIASLAVEAALVWAFVSGLAQRWVQRIAAPDLAVTTVTADPPPPPRPPPDNVEKPAGSAAAQGPQAARAEPSPDLVIASPSPAAPVAGAGLAGSGHGAGGSGSGSGAGSSGTATGSGAVVAPAQRIAGTLSDRDYPRGAGHPAGTVAIAFRVRTDGAVDGCQVIASSGVPALDSLTCRLVQQRFRYRPARDASGHPVETTLRTSFTYGAR